ncbi:MAG TPA: SusC/RagA family TonB-linked outer membrane protein [Cyclobacteriaceae bacterium]
MNKALRSVFFLILITTSIVSELKAQQVVKGTIKDNNGEPLIGATILEVGTTNGVISDINGNYSISVEENAQLSVTFVGFISQVIDVSNRSVIDITLEIDAEELEEVVVTALGFKANKDNVGYANSQLKTDDIVKAAEPNLLNAISGKATGVTISRNSGDPGAGSYIQIRGVSTLTGGSQPLIVVDGVPISNDNFGTGQIAQQSRLNDINPNDIENISVLKGASAAALWGTSAMNGAIVITTKSGKYNQKLQVSVKSTYSIDRVSRKYPLQDKFGQGNNGVYDPVQRDSWGDKIANRSGGQDEFDTSGEFFVDQNGDVYYPVISKNSQETFLDENFDQVFQNGHFWENNVSLTAGNETGNVFFSISNLDQQGIIKDNSDYNRTTARFNGEQLLNDDFVLNVNINYTRTTSNRIRRGAQSSGLYLGLTRTPPDFNNIGYRGNYFPGPDASPEENRHRSYRNHLGSGNAGYNNPIWTTKEQEDLAIVDRFINNFKLTYSVTDWIDVIGRVGLDSYSEQKDQFFTPGSAAGGFRTGLFETLLRKNSILNTDLIVKGNRSISSNFDLTMLVGFNYNQSKRYTTQNEIINFIQFADVETGARDLNNALPENRTASANTTESRKSAVYTEVTLQAYQNLFITGSLRGEVSSTFGDQADPSFWFPSITGAWQFHELVDINFLSFAKLRASYGEVGQEPGPYNTNNRIVQPTYTDALGGSISTGLFGNGGFTESIALGNPFLEPERKTEIELGTDLRFINDRLSLSLTYYDNRTEGAIFFRRLPNTTGYDRIVDNFANVENKGTEIDLGFKVLDKKDLTVQTNLLYSRNENLVADLKGAEGQDIGGLSAVSNRVVEGQPFGVFFGSKTKRDESGEIVLDENGFPEQDEEPGVIGDPNPDWRGSWITNVQYKNFGFSMLFETFQGADIYAGTKSALYDIGTWGASAIETTTDQNLLDYNGDVIFAGTTFRGVVHDFGAGPVALTEPWYQADGGFFGSGNDELYVEDGSWTRLRRIELSYTLNNQWIKNKGFESIQLSATGRNLVIWTPFEGNDPDTNLNGVSNARGIEYFNNPGTKSYVFSIQLNF